MHGSPGILSKQHVISEVSSSFVEIDRRTLPARESKADTPRFLITLDRGIGDAVLVGLSAVDQIIQNDPAAYGKIDILCTLFQSQIFKYDPRINRVIQTDKKFSAGPYVTEWLRGITLDAEAAQIMHFLQSRRYEAVLPTVMAPGLYLRLHSHLMYPRVFKLAKNLLLRGAPSEVPVRKFIRQMVNRYFGKDIPASELHDEISLYLDVQQIHKAATVIEQMKKNWQLLLKR